MGVFLLEKIRSCDHSYPRDKGRFKLLAVVITEPQHGAIVGNGWTQALPGAWVGF